MVGKVKKFEHITPTLTKLHWLPIPQRIVYKLTLLTFKALHGLAPQYLTELLERYSPTRNLRSMDLDLLVIPKTRLKSYGDRAFLKAAPTLWNNLPLNIRRINDVVSFKSALNTHLYRDAYL